MKERFEVVFLPDAVEFMNQMEENAREKMYSISEKHSLKTTIKSLKS